MLPLDDDDDNDALAPIRDQFYKQPGQIYLDGNSLGLLSRPAEAALLRALSDWKTLGIEGWTEATPPWFFLAERLGAKTAPLIGAAPENVIVANSTTVNLHQLLATLYPGTDKILTDSAAFPSDLYAIQSHLRLRGLDPATHIAVTDPNEDAIEAALADDDSVALAVLPGVVYTTGRLLDMARITRACRSRNVVILWDLSHSIGAVPHALDAWDADAGFWCGYKYLCGGPGAAGGLYRNARHADKLPGLAGWFSADKTRQFDMRPDLELADTAGALQIGTPNILSMAPLDGALDLIADAGIDRLRARSLALTEFLMTRIEAELDGFGFTFANPRAPEQRGGHVSLVHPDAARLSKALRADGVIPDFRHPNIVRLAPVALYTSFAEVHEAVQRLKRIVTERRHETIDLERGLVP